MARGADIYLDSDNTGWLRRSRARSVGSMRPITHKDSRLRLPATLAMHDEELERVYSRSKKTVQAAFPVFGRRLRLVTGSVPAIRSGRRGSAGFVCKPIEWSWFANHLSANALSNLLRRLIETAAPGKHAGEW